MLASFRCTAKLFSYTYIHIYVCVYIFFTLFFIIGYYEILDIVTCAIKSLLFIYFIYSSVYLLIPNF